jgi:hypothetical protein
MQSNYDATDVGKAPLRCIACERVIPDGKWFARFRLEGSRVAVCRPYCMEKFLDNEDTYATKMGLPYLTESVGVRSL